MGADEPVSRRTLLATLLVVAAAPGAPLADQFLALSTSVLQGDPRQLGWSTLKVSFRVEFPAPASGRKFLEHQYRVIDAVERDLLRTQYDPAGGPSERARVERVVEAAIRRSAPRGTVLRVFGVEIAGSR